MNLTMTMPSVSAERLAGAIPNAQRDLTDVLDMLTHTAAAQLGLVTESPSVLGTAFYLGDGLQRSVTDGLFDLFRPRTWSPDNLLHLSSEALRQTIQLTKFCDPAQARLAWEELRNKFEVFALVKNLSSILKLPPGQFIPLPELVAKAYTLPPFKALWAVEGLGHYYADLYWEQKGIPSGLLSEAQAPVPAESLLMLHAGMGLAFADRLLDTLSPDFPSASRTAAALKQFVSLCEDNSRPAYLGAAIEALGLVTRDFYPDSLEIVHQQLAEVAPDLTGFFWHGVGRALYFSRQYFLPVLTVAWNGINDEIPNYADRQSAMAGLAWAVTLVNMRQPAIIENVIHSYIEDSPYRDAFTNGVISSIIMRQDTTPDQPFISAFCEHGVGDARLTRLWKRLISEPCGKALNEYYPVLKQHDAMGEIFRFNNLAAFVAKLRQQTGQ